MATVATIYVGYNGGYLEKYQNDMQDEQWETLKATILEIISDGKDDIVNMIYHEFGYSHNEMPAYIDVYPKSWQYNNDIREVFISCSGNSEEQRNKQYIINAVFMIAMTRMIRFYGLNICLNWT